MEKKHSILQQVFYSDGHKRAVKSLKPIAFSYAVTFCIIFKLRCNDTAEVLFTTFSITALLYHGLGLTVLEPETVTFVVCYNENKFALLYSKSKYIFSPTELI